MPTLKPTAAAANALAGLWAVSLTGFIIATLYLARDLLIPLALAALLTFLVAPLVTRLERWLGRVGAVLVVVTLILGATGAGGWVLTRQLVDLAIKLPDYKENIQTKLRCRNKESSSVFGERRRMLSTPHGACAIPARMRSSPPWRTRCCS